MILDNLNDSALYEGINPLFKQAFDYIKSLDLATVELGKTVLVDDELIVMVNSTGLKSPDKARMEVHNAFIDIHVPISTVERFAWKHRSTLETESEPFDHENDAQHFEDAPPTYVDVQPGEFVIVFPNDAHAGCIGSGEICKIVVKVKVR